MSSPSTSTAYVASKRLRCFLFPVRLAASTFRDNQFAARRSVPTLKRLQDSAKLSLGGITQNGALAQRRYRELVLTLCIVAIERSLRRRAS